MDHDRFIKLVAERAGVSREQAEALTEATLATLAQRITGGEAKDLASQLPKPLQPPLLRPDEPAERFDLDEFTRRVATRAGLDPEQAGNGVRAVFATVREAVTGGEFDDVLAQLPADFRQLAVSGT